VLLIGFGLGLGFLGRFLTHIQNGPALLRGWTGYAPIARVAPLALLRHDVVPPWGRLLIWLALVAVWTVLAYWMLQPGGMNRRDDAVDT
jgi:hypothetical protein